MFEMKLGVYNEDFGLFTKQVYDGLGFWRWDQLGNVQGEYFRVRYFTGFVHLASS